MTKSLYELIVFRSSRIKPGTTEYCETLPGTHCGLIQGVQAAIKVLDLNSRLDYCWLRQVDKTLPDASVHRDGQVCISKTKWNVGDFVADDTER